MFGRRRKELGIALGGGAARGIAHVGVLKVLAEHDIPVSYVAGTSAGSLIGSLFCAGYRWKEIGDITREITWGDLVSPALSGMGLVRPEKLEKALDEIIENRDFFELEIPFKTIATDIESAEQIVFDTGPVASAVRASCSIPGIFEPMEIDGRLLVDGGLVNNVPVSVVRDMGADVVLGVDLNADRIARRRPDNVFEIFLRSLDILVYRATQERQKGADLIVTPDLSLFGYRNLKRVDEMIAVGEQAMLDHIQELQELMR